MKKMLCYLAITTAATECAVCGGPVAAGLAGHSDDFPPQPICWACLRRSDARLMTISLLIAAMHKVAVAMDPEGDLKIEEVREVLRLIRVCLLKKAT